MMRRLALFALALCLPASAQAQEAFVGVYKHAVDTPFTLFTGEEGADIAAGFRLEPVEALSAIGSPAPYLVGSVNTAGDTSFVAAGLSWRIGIADEGRWYVRPGVGIAIHDGPATRFDPAREKFTDLGSRVVFEPEIGIGYRLSDRVSAEAHWMHLSHAQVFSSQQNPGLDMIGVRLNIGID